MYDLGEALYGFLIRFGEEFDVTRVSHSYSLRGRREEGHRGGGGCIAARHMTHIMHVGPWEEFGGTRLNLVSVRDGRCPAACRGIRCRSAIDAVVSVLM